MHEVRLALILLLYFHESPISDISDNLSNMFVSAGVSIEKPFATRLLIVYEVK